MEEDISGTQSALILKEMQVHVNGRFRFSKVSIDKCLKHPYYYRGNCSFKEEHQRMIKLTHISLLSADVQKALQFYQDVFGFEVVNNYGNYAELKVGDDFKLTLFERAEMAKMLPSTRPELVNGQRAILEFHVDKLDDFCDMLRGKYVPLVKQPEDKPDWGIRVTYIEDLDGNLIELYETLPQP